MSLAKMYGAPNYEGFSIQLFFTSRQELYTSNMSKY